MEWRCHTFRQCRGQPGFDGPAKALPLPVTVRALQIGNPGYIICKEHVYQWHWIQPNHRGEMRKSQKANRWIKAFQSFKWNLTRNFIFQKIQTAHTFCLQFPHETLPEDCNTIQVTYCVMFQLFVRECVVHISLIFKQKLCISLTSAGMLSFTRHPGYVLEHVGQIALPEGIWLGQMQRWTTCIKVILFFWRNILGS